MGHPLFGKTSWLRVIGNQEDYLSQDLYVKKHPKLKARKKN